MAFGGPIFVWYKPFVSAAKFCVTHFHTCRSVQVGHSKWIQMDRFGRFWLIIWLYILASYIFSSAQLFVAIEAKRNTTAPFPITNQTLSSFPNKLKTNPSKVHTSTRKTTPSAKVQLLALHGIARMKAKLFFGYANLHGTSWIRRMTACLIWTFSYYIDTINFPGPPCLHPDEQARAAGWLPWAKKPGQGLLNASASCSATTSSYAKWSTNGVLKILEIGLYSSSHYLYYLYEWMMTFQSFQRTSNESSKPSKPRCLQNSLQMRELICCKLSEVNDVLTTRKQVARNDSAVAKHELGGQMPTSIVLRRFQRIW